VLVAVLGYFGLRPGEALALTWQQVQDDHLWITHTIAGLDEDDQRTLEEGVTKTRNERVVPFKLAPFMPSILREWKLRMGPHDASTPVFPAVYGGREPWLYHQYLTWRTARWQKHLHAAGVEYKKPYHLRHSCITMWIYQGIALPEIAKRAGHSQQTSTSKRRSTRPAPP
jgi:integrase